MDSNHIPQVLLVEDEDDLRAILEEYLTDNGIQVAAFPSADKAMPYWDSHSESIYLILTDIKMPGALDGVDLAKHIRTDLKHHPKIVFISGYESPSPKLLDELDVQSFLSKPFRISELSALCQKAFPTT